MKTLIISSSLSPTSKSNILCKKTEENLKKLNVDTTLRDIRHHEMNPMFKKPTNDLEKLNGLAKEADNIVFGMGVHCYSVNDGLKIILDTIEGAAIAEKFYGILCAAGGYNSYLSTMHLTQICMNEWRMIQLPRIVFAAHPDYDGEKLISENVIERLKQFSTEFVNIGKRLID